MKISSAILLAVLFLPAVIVGINCNGKQSAGVTPEDSSSKLSSAILPSKGNSSTGIGDFVSASKAIIPAVVHIETIYSRASAGSTNSFGQLFGGVFLLWDQVRALQ